MSKSLLDCLLIRRAKIKKVIRFFENHVEHMIRSGRFHWLNCRAVFQSQIPRPLLAQLSWGCAWSSSAPFWSPGGDVHDGDGHDDVNSLLATFSTPSMRASASRSTSPVYSSSKWSCKKPINYRFCLGRKIALFWVMVKITEFVIFSFTWK